MPAWFSYAATVANLTGDGEDKSTGLKHWFAVTTPLFAATCAAPTLLATDDDGRVALCLIGAGVFALYSGFCALLFVAEPAGPSRRVRVHWERERAGALRRFLGPGLGKTSVLVALLGVLGMVLIAACGIYAIDSSWVRGRFLSTSAVEAEERIALFAVYAALFFLFVVGLSAWLRSRGNSPWIARLIALAVLFLIHAVPWVVAAIGGVLSSGRDQDWMLVAAPSPFYVVVMLKAVERTESQGQIVLGLACAIGWGVGGILLMGAASVRSRRAVAQYDAAMAQADAALRAEDEAAARQGQGSA
jgi:hypothetical protein